MAIRVAALRRRALAPDPGAAQDVSWLRGRLEVPLLRNGYALVASSSLTSALGLVYWLIAARAYSPEAVGLCAALISAMTLLANVAQLNLKSALNRFLPAAGTTTARFVTRSYLVTLGLAAAAAVVFLVGLGLWSPKLEFLVENPGLAVWFVAATMVWTIFVLQDSVLAGIRRAGWVPVENLAYSVLKIVLLVAFAAVAPTLGAFLAWTVPLLLLVVPMNLLLFRRLIPAHVKSTEHVERPAGAGRVARYVAMDYVAYLISAATIGALPLVVLAVSGAEANAYYFVSWSIAYALYLVPLAMGMSMIAEASLEPERLEAHTRRTLVETAAVLVPAVAAVVVAAPIILGVMGGSYASEATGLLRLLALSALPACVFVAYTNVARVQGRMGAVVGATALLYGLVLAIGLPLLGPLGIEGLGVGWLAAQTIVAVGIAGLSVSRGLGGEPALRALSNVRIALLSWWRRVSSVTALRTAVARLRRGSPESRDWLVQRHLRTLNDVAVSVVGPRRGPPAALVKRAATASAGTGLRRQREALAELRQVPGLERFSELAPDVLASDEAAGREFIAETHMPGVSCEALLRDGASHERILEAVEQAIAPLHDATRAEKLVGEPLLRSWVDAPLERVAPVVAAHSGLAAAEPALRRLGEELREELTGRRVETSRIHGDLSPGNVLLDPEGGAVLGIVDWEESREPLPPEIDLFHLLITTRMAAERRELGDVVAELLAGESLCGPARAFVLLAWLRHVAANIGKSPRYGRSRIWIRRNLDPVLGAFLGEPEPGGAQAPAGLPHSQPTSPASRLAGWLSSTRARIAAAPLEWLASFGVLALAVVLWVVSLGEMDPRQMTDTGLISVLPLSFGVALFALTASFVARVLTRPDRSPLLVAHLLALIAFLHATPSILYETLRYSWAWKHVGIVDYIERHGEVKPDIDLLGVYHNWPGFFGLDSMLTQLAGLDGTLELARWGPVIFTVLSLGAVLFALSALTRDKRVLFTGAWLFLIANWVGQEYFSPQALAFFLYLMVLGIVLRWLRQGSSQAVEDGRRRVALTALVLVLVAAIAASHALTGVMVAVALATLAVSRVGVHWGLPVAAAAIVAGWDLVFASNFVGQNAGDVVDKIRLPWLTTESSLADAGQFSDGQSLIALVSRGLVVAVVLLAAAGAVRQLRAGRLNRAAAVLAVAPLLLFASGDYDGEILFRIYLFAVPFLAFLAAYAVVGRPVFLSVVCAVVLAGFLVAYYGKENQNHFSPEEVAAANYVYDAPPGTHLIEGSRNYPTQFKNYERYRYVTISREPPESRARLVAEPVRVLSEWMSGSSRSLLLITRSQKTEVDELGAMPRGSLERIERALSASPRFETVFQNRDATVFRLAGARAG